MHPQAINKYRILSHASVSCRGLFRGLVVHVLACPADPGRFYGRGQTGPNSGKHRKKEKGTNAAGRLSSRCGSGGACAVRFLWTAAHMLEK